MRKNSRLVLYHKIVIHFIMRTFLVCTLNKKSSQNKDFHIVKTLITLTEYCYY